MQAKLLDGKGIAQGLGTELAEAGRQFLQQMGRKARLELILVGDDTASQVYVRRKQAQAAQAEITAGIQLRPATVSQGEIAELIDRLNQDDAVDGILVQLPLPEGLHATPLIERIAPEKDVDGFTSANAGLWIRGDGRGHVPCTPAGCLYLLRQALPDLAGRHAVIVGRSMVVGRPMAALLLAADCTVTTLHSRTRNPTELSRQGDIVVAAAGRMRLINADWIAERACVIDVGIHRGADGKLCGDVDFAAVCDRAAAITPVPGGVGPMTVVYLLYNTLRAAIGRAGLAAEISLPEKMQPFPVRIT